MAGTMPHAIFIETDVDGDGLVGAYAAELPGCAVFAATDDEAAGAMPRRVSAFTGWLREAGETAPSVVGDNWYEVDALDAGDPTSAIDLLDQIERQDVTFVRELGGQAPELSSDPIDRLYAARDALTDALESAGPLQDGVRRFLRLAIADDLRAAEALRAGA
jgi:hypothetical protein